MPVAKSPLVVKSDKRPVAIVSLQDWETIGHFVRRAPKECLWYMTIAADYSHPAGYIYRLSGVFIPKQRCGNKEVETPDGHALIEMWTEEAAKRIAAGDPGDPVMLPAQLASTGGCWAHSHVEMEVNPSQQDMSQWKIMKDGATKARNKQPQAMLIVNRRDEYTLYIYDPFLGLEFEMPPLQIDRPFDLKWIDKAIMEKLTQMPGDTSSASTSKSTTSSTSSSTSSSSSSSTNNGEVGFVYTTLERSEKKL